MRLDENKQNEDLVVSRIIPEANNLKVTIGLAGFVPCVNHLLNTAAPNYPGNKMSPYYYSNKASKFRGLMITIFL